MSRADEPWNKCDFCDKKECCSSQKMKIDSLDARQAMLYFLMKGYRRHLKDNIQTAKDIEELLKQGVTLPDGLNFLRWIDV